MTATELQPAFVLVRPQLGENIGAAARAMLNFGLTRMRLVAPRDGWPNPRAVAAASGAGRVLDAAPLFPDVSSALADLEVVYATTARPRGMTREVLTPAEAAARTRTQLAAGVQVGFLFGPERAGLENEDIVHATHIVTVPVNPEFASLNLAQCVLLMAYELGREGGQRPAAELVIPGGRLASREEVERLAAHLLADLEEAGFFFPPEKAPSMRQALRAMLGRMPLSRQDVQTLHGILRQLARRRDRG